MHCPERTLKEQGLSEISRTLRIRLSGELLRGVLIHFQTSCGLAGKTVGYEEGSRDVNNLTHAKINKNRDLVMCFKCQRQGHFANRCPTRKDVASTKEPVQPKVSIKYLEFIHFKTRGIIKGTDNSTWDDFCTKKVVVHIWYSRGFDHEWKQGLFVSRDKIRQRHNDYLDDYFESLDKERTDRKEEEPGIVEDTSTPVVQTFQEYVSFLNLIKDDEETSKEWDTYRDRTPKNHMTGEEDMESLEEYQWNLGKKGESSAVEKEKERLEHFGIKLEEEEESKQKQPAYHWREAYIKCYKCQGLGYYAIECQDKRKKDRDMFASYKEISTSKPTDKEDTQSSSSDDFTVIT
nr:hypothetical protein [Tanacetum cinerariifolium]